MKLRPWSWGSQSRVFFFLLALFTIPAAFASRLAVVDVDQVEVFEAPRRDAKVVGTLKKNTEVLASNHPTDNFHKIKTKDDLKGWVLADTLILHEIPEGAPERTMASDDKSPEVTNERVHHHKAEPNFKAKVFGGADFYNAAGIIRNFNNFTLGYDFGAEFHFILNPTFSVGLRGESIFNSANLTDSTSGNVFNVSISSLPILVGLEASLVDEDGFSIHLGVFGGYAFLTQVISTAVATSSAGTSSSGALTGLGKLDFRFRIFKVLGVLIEGGYRFLETPTLVAPTTGDGAAVFNSTYTINLTGPYAGLGLGVVF
ncbi:MAG: SH3 domain-containing protein [Bdellovibrio sp.]|nr:SH3 domain-containing protein [Bdellovibrio sp.]